MFSRSNKSIPQVLKELGFQEAANLPGLYFTEEWKVMVKEERWSLWPFHGVPNYSPTMCDCCGAISGKGGASLHDALFKARKLHSRHEQRHVLSVEETPANVKKVKLLNWGRDEKSGT